MKINIDKKIKRKITFLISKKSDTFLNQSPTNSSLKISLFNKGNKKSDKSLFKLENKKYEIIDNDKLNEIFKLFKKLNNNNRNNNSGILHNNIFSSLENQQKQLFTNKLFEKNRKNISKFLSKKLNINEKGLLINKADSILYKNEIVNDPENNPFFKEKNR